MSTNGYINIYKPNHPRAMSNGTVYEHILVAEEMLGRSLEEGEVVHHIDHCRSNNDKNNLMVFKTSKDHNKFHSFGNAVKLEDGSYICTETSHALICPICGNEKMRKATICAKCFNKLKSKQPNITVDELKKLLLLRNFSEISRKCGVTDNAVRKWCKKYNLPYKTSILNKMTDDEILSL